MERKKNKMKIKIKNLRKLIKETLLIEMSRPEIEKLIGKEAAMKYRKKDGSIKTYFGRFTKISGENVYMGVLGKGLRMFKISNILQISPAQFEQEQLEELNKICNEISPPGWSGTVKAMKKHKDIKNPWALAWHMKKKGAKPHYKSVKEKCGGSIKNRKLIKETLLIEMSRSEIENLIGKKVAMKYREKDGSIKICLGRFAKISGENVYINVLGEGLRMFKISNILQISPAQFE